MDRDLNTVPPLPCSVGIHANGWDKLEILFLSSFGEGRSTGCGVTGHDTNSDLKKEKALVRQAKVLARQPWQPAEKARYRGVRL